MIVKSFYICPIKITKKDKAMKTQITITSNFSVEIEIFDFCVIVKTNYHGDTRKNSYESVSEAINNTTIPAVMNYLKAL
jgi:hypothetical protein